jgi:hypothetical protein
MKRIKRLSLLVLTMLLTVSSFAAKYTLSGYAKDKDTGEELIGVNVYVHELKTGTVSNLYGFFSLTLDEGLYTVQISYLGYETREEKVKLSTDLRLNFELATNSKEVDEVIVSAQRKDKNITNVEMSVEKLQVSQIKQLPSFMGETDVIKSLTLLPGVQSGGEGSSGMYVRGGGADQNMILLDEAPVFNSSHLMGFFSVFNSDVVKDVKLYKGGIPSRYGGRLSSLIDIRMKDGNSRKVSATGSFGNVSGKLMVEGPIIKDRVSFVVAARRTWADVFLAASPDEALNQSTLYFYDLNAKLNVKLGENDRIYFSGYFGRDVFGIDVFGMEWGNKTASLRWNHVFSNKLFMNNTFIYSDYDYNLNISPDEANEFDWNSNINDFMFKNRFNCFLNPKNMIYFGAEASHHHFEPGALDSSEDGNYKDIETPSANALEFSFFIGNEHKITERLNAEYGIRYTIFQNIGAGTVYQYADPENPTKGGIIGTKEYDDWEPIHTESGVEPRFNLNYRLNEVSSVKTSYNRTYQYLNLVTNTNSPTPLDIYIPSSQYIKPQMADQVALGYFRNFKENMFETSLETYYKKMYNQIDYIDNANLMLNPHLETEMKAGEAYSYGVEFMAKKQLGKVNGWLGYTYSKTWRQIDGINNDEEYAPTYDRTHDVSVAVNYKLNRKISLGTSWVYATGIAYTVPNGSYRYGGNNVPTVSDRNSYRAPAFHRLDLSATFKLGKQDVEKKVEQTLNVSLYNVYGRKNPYSIYFRDNPENRMETQAVKLSIVGVPLPAITYSFKF